jgi:hypothetical protein
MAGMPSTSWERPHLFLDVDGVLNAFELDPSMSTDGFDDFDVHEVEFELEAGYSHTFILCLSPAMGARIAQLAVDIWWATTWEHRADSAIAPLCGLPRGLPVLTARDAGEGWDLDWKFLEVRRTVQSDPRPFVWIDDDIDFFRIGSITAREWAAGISMPSLLITPDARTGLRPQQLDAVEEFVRWHASTGDDETHVS